MVSATSLLSVCCKKNKNSICEMPIAIWPSKNSFLESMWRKRKQKTQEFIIKTTFPAGHGAIRYSVLTWKLQSILLAHVMITRIIILFTFNAKIVLFYFISLIEHYMFRPHRVILRSYRFLYMIIKMQRLRLHLHLYICSSLTNHISTLVY
jgi:hypothetical protein